MQFSEFGIDKRLLNAISHLGFDQATDIQARAIPEAMVGRDLLASSKTGSGKTIAYLVPAIHAVSSKRSLSKRDPRVLILTPTRELAKQVYATLRTLLAGSKYTAVLICGGENFNDQHKDLQKDPHFVVATPGRMADHLSQRNVFLHGLELLILDEADRMLDLGFADALLNIHRSANHRKRQTLFFSATLKDAGVNELATELLNSPSRVAIGDDLEEHGDITQHVLLADHLDHKQALLKHFLDQLTIRQAIVFTATRLDTERLAALIVSWGIEAKALHGKLSQGGRNQVMTGFAKAHFKVLVSTDLASRGLDISAVSHVFNFDVPKPAEEFVHRTGRTGRAGFQGDAYTFVGPKDWLNFKAVEAYLSRTFEYEQVAGMEASFTGIVQSKAPKRGKTYVADKNSDGAAKNEKASKRKPSRKVVHSNHQDGFEAFRLPKKKP